MSELNQKPSEAAHAASGHTNKVDPMLLTSEEALQVKHWSVIGRRAAFFRSELHESCIFPSL